MRSTINSAAIVVACIVGLLGLTWLVQGNDFFLYKTFAPKYEQTRRTVFEQSRAFNQGMIQELDNMRFDYLKLGDGSPKERAALASIILHRASGYNMDDPSVPSDLRDFVNQLRREQAGAR